MQMTTEARAWLDTTVKRILARHALGDAERAGITYELMSHLHAAGEARAIAAGRAEVDRGDLEGAFLEMGGDEKLAAAFVQPLSRPIVRVLFWRRVGAFTIDTLLILIGLGFIHSFFTMGLLAVSGQPVAPGMAVDDSWWGLFPWGYHDVTLPLWIQAAIAVASATLIMSYYTLVEGHDGRSLGKRALGLRVMRVDGLPVTYREAFIRNLAKLQPFILVLDVLVMLLAFRNEAQRVSDRAADTIVVRA